MNEGFLDIKEEGVMGKPTNEGIGGGGSNIEGAGEVIHGSGDGLDPEWDL